MVQFGGDDPGRGRRPRRTACSTPSARPSTTPTSPSSTTRTREDELWAVRESGLGATAHVPGKPDTWPGWEDSAVAGRPARRLPARPASLYRGVRLRQRHRPQPVRPLRAGLCAHPHPLRPLLHRRRGDLPPVHGARRRPRRLLRRLPVRRARRRPGARRAADQDVRRGGRRPLRAGQGALRPRQPDEPRQGRPPRRRSTRTSGSAADWAPRRRTTAVLRLPRGRRLLHPGRQPLRRRRQVPPARPRGRRRDVPLLPGHRRGGALHPRPGPAAVRDARRPRRRARHRRLALHRGHATPSTSAWPARAARPTAPRRVDMATYKAEFLAHHYRQPAAPTRRLRHRLAAAGGRAVDRLPAGARWSTRCRTRPPAHGSATRLAGPARTARSRCSPRRPCSSGGSPAPPDRPARPPAARCCSGPTPSPTTSTPHVGHAAVEVLEDAGWEVDLPTEPVCCGLTWISTGQLGAAKQRAAPHASQPWRRTCAPAASSSAWSPAAPRCSAPTPPSCSPPTTTCTGSRTTPSPSPSCSPTHTDGLGAAPARGRPTRSPRCTATSTPSSAGTPTATCSTGAGRRRRAARLGLLRAGRQLRLHRRPRRGQRGLRGAGAAPRARADPAGARRRVLLPHPDPRLDSGGRRACTWPSSRVPDPATLDAPRRARDPRPPPRDARLTAARRPPCAGVGTLADPPARPTTDEEDTT